MTHETQRAMVKKHLLSGRRISQWLCIQKFRATRLSAIIQHLEKTLNIQSEWVTKRGKRFKEYFINLEKLRKKP